MAGTARPPASQSRHSRGGAVRVAGRPASSVPAPARWKLGRRGLAILTLLATLAAFGPARAADPYTALAVIRPPAARPAAELGIPALDGSILRIADFAGKVVFVNFWATWCPPCRQEMPAMERLYRRFADRGLVVVAVSIDTEGAAAVRPFVLDHGLSYLIGLDRELSAAGRYGVRALPSTYLVDRRGHLAGQALGPREWDTPAAHALSEHLLAQP
jgi:thiol-disulfide isomerase/thioredoxin